MTGQRVATLALLGVGLVGVWQAGKLTRWAIDGPGPGLWPSIVSLVFVALAVVVFLFPGRQSNTEDGDTEVVDEATRRATLGTFGIYALTLVVLAVGAAFAGFVVTSLLVSVLVIRFAERRSWRAALVYGTVCALVGLYGFGWLLRVDLPSTGIERALLSLVR